MLVEARGPEFGPSTHGKYEHGCWFLSPVLMDGVREWETGGFLGIAG